MRPTCITCRRSTGSAGTAPPPRTCPDEGVAMPVKATFRPKRASVNAAGRSEAVYRELERRAGKAKRLTLALYEAHRKTGAYGRGFRTERVRIRGQAAVRLVNDSDHAAILEHGSRPHVIEPKNKQ